MLEKDLRHIYDGNNHKERGSRIVEFYKTWDRGKYFGKDKPVQRVSSDQLLLKYAELVGNAQTDSNWFEGMKGTLALETAKNNTAIAKAASQSDPHDPIKLIEYSQALKKRDELDLDVEKNRKNPEYGAASSQTMALLEDLSILFTEYGYDLFGGQIRNEQENTAVALSVVSGLVEVLNEIESNAQGT